MSKPLTFRLSDKMGNYQSGSGGCAGKEKGEQKEKKKYEPPVSTRWVGIKIIWITVVTRIVHRVGKITSVSRYPMPPISCPA